MKLKDATSNFGSVGTLLTVLLMFLVSAGAAFACPGHGSKQVVYKTYYGSEPVRTTVVSYGASPCTESTYVPRKAKYVTTSSNGYYNAAPTYVAVRQMPRTRYVAVRNYDYDNYAPQYVAVRRQPAYVEMNSKYALMSNNYVPARYVAVRDRNIDAYDYAPVQYVAVRHAPATEYVAVRNVDSAYGMRSVGYIPVPSSDYDSRPVGYIPIHSSGCGCAVSNEEAFEDVTPRHVVLKSDYIDGTQAVVYQSPNYDDTAYMTVPSNTEVIYNVGRFHNNGENIVPVSYVNTGSVSYVPANYDSDFDDQAILDTSNVTYVAANDIEDACLSPVAVRTMPMHAGTVRYVSEDDVGDYAPVSYVPINDMEYTSVPVANVTCVPTHKTHLKTVSYVPAENVDYVKTTDTDACECPTSANSVVTNLKVTDQVADTSAIVEDNDNDLTTTETSDMQTVAGRNGYNDGFENGKQAALNGKKYKPASSSDFHDADNGYDGSFGSKDVYAHTYRDSYLRGYRAGFDSISSSD
jgi:hypothetical protein